MLSKVFEWSRVGNPTPSDDFVEKRKAVVQTLAGELPKKVPLLIDCVCGAVGGLTPRFVQESEIVATLVAAIKAQQPAFPEKLAENALDLRVVCALVVGEIADRARKSTKPPTAASEVMSAMVQAALGSKPLPAQKYLRDVLAELAHVSTAALARSADFRRERYSLTYDIESIVEPTDLLAFWKDAKPKLLQLGQRIADNEEVDREELDTLWWAFNGVHIATDTSFDGMTVPAAALRAGVDLADTVLMPPLANTRFLLRRVLSTNRKSTDLAERPASELFAGWNKALAADLVPKNAKTLEFVRANPTVLPFSWVCLRIAETDRNAITGFKKATGWDPAVKMTPVAAAFQIFDERVAQRFHENSAAG